MYDFLKWTAWTMEPPKTFGTFHLLFLIFGLLACVLFAWLFRKSTERQNNIILLSIGIFLAVSEVYKQLFYTYYIGGGEYQWWIFPFQLCSVPMYLCLILPFIKSERVKHWLYTFLATYNLLGGFVSMFEQSGLSHEYITLTLHAYIWHLLLVFLGFYIIASNRAAHSVKDIIPAAGVFLVLASVAQAINIIFREHSIKMFYISPYHSTPLIVFKDIEAACGWFVNMIVYCIALAIGAFIFLLIGIYVRRLNQNVAKRRNEKRAGA